MMYYLKDYSAPTHWPSSNILQGHNISETASVHIQVKNWGGTYAVVSVRQS